MVIYLPNTPPIDGSDPITKYVLCTRVNNEPGTEAETLIVHSTATFQLSYTLKHTQLLLDAVHKLMIEGFTPNANTPDPNFGTCLQCAVFDRARLKAVPVFNRSEICSNCFDQYCFDPKNPPSRDELPNRKQVFKDPDPTGLTSFVARNKSGFIGGLVGLVVLIGALIAGL